MRSAASAKSPRPNIAAATANDAARIALPSLDERQQASPIGITDLRQRAVGPSHGEHEVDHATHVVAEVRRHRHAIARGEQQKLLIGFDRVAVVARRALEVHAIGADLRAALGNQHAQRRAAASDARP